MPLVLYKRQSSLTEMMDQADCNPVLLDNTYRQFSRINLLLSQWRWLYKNYLLERMTENREYSLLDIGFGGGDIPRKLSEWAKKDGVQLQVTAIETDRRAYEYALSQPSPDNVQFEFISSTELNNQDKRFDFVISNHLLHHLNREETQSLLREAKEMARNLVLFNDIERSDLGYLLFNIFSRLIFRRSFITVDGLTSIKRSYTRSELNSLVTGDWEVRRLFPFRLILTYDAKS